MKHLRHIVVSPVRMTNGLETVGFPWDTKKPVTRCHPTATSSRGTCMNSGGFHSGEFIPSEGGKILRVQSGRRLIWCFLLRFDSWWLKWELFRKLPFIIIIMRCFFFFFRFLLHLRSLHGVVSFWTKLIEQNSLLADFMLFSLFCWQDGSNTDILDLIGSRIADIAQQVKRQSLSSRLIRTATGLKLWGDDTLLSNCKLTSK